MVVAFDAATSATSASGSSLTYSHTCSGSDRALFVGVGGEWFNAIVSSITYSGTALTLSWNAGFSTFYGYAGGYLVAPASGANNVLVTMTASVDVIATGATSLTSVHQTTPTGTAVFEVSTAVSTADLAVTSETDGLVCDSISTTGLLENLNVGAGQTQRYHSDTTGESQTKGSTEVGAASVTMSWDSSFGTMTTGHGAIPFKPAGVAAASLVYRSKNMGALLHY